MEGQGEENRVGVTQDSAEVTNQGVETEGDKTAAVLFKKDEGLEQDEHGQPKAFEAVRSEEGDCYYLEQKVQVTSGSGKLRLCCQKVDEAKLDENTYPVVQLQAYPNLEEKAEEARVYLWENGKLSRSSVSSRRERTKNNSRVIKGKGDCIVVGRIYIPEKDKTYDVVTPAAGVEGQGEAVENNARVDRVDVTQEATESHVDVIPTSEVNNQGVETEDDKTVTTPEAGERPEAPVTEPAPGDGGTGIVVGEEE